MSPRHVPDKFHVAFSFAGEQRELVRAVAEAVEDRLGPSTVYYDDWFLPHLAGADADLKLQKIYGERCALAVVCVSERYGDKPWTLAEHEAIRARVMQARCAGAESEKLGVLPLRVGDGEVEGILFNTIVPDIRRMTVTDAADLIVERLQLVLPGPAKKEEGTCSCEPPDLCSGRKSAGWSRRSLLAPATQHPAPTPSTPAATPRRSSATMATLDPLASPYDKTFAYAVAKGILRCRSTLAWRGGQICPDVGAPIPVPDDEPHLAAKTKLLLTRWGIEEVPREHLAVVWHRRLASGDEVEKDELLQEARDSLGRSDLEVERALQRLHTSVMTRLAPAVGSFRAVDRHDADATAQERASIPELAPLLLDWPRRLIEAPEWRLLQAPLPGQEPIPLDEVWVDLRVLPVRPLDEASTAAGRERRGAGHAWRGQSDDLPTLPAQHLLDRLRNVTVVIGEPGSGKTTFLKWLARRLVRDVRGRFLLPLFVPLRAYAREVERSQTSLVDFALRGAGLSDPAQLSQWTNLLAYLSGTKRDTVLLLLDGWDEVPEASREAMLVEIRDTVRAYAAVITSRRSGFPLQLPGDEYVELAELSERASATLLHRWLGQGGDPSRANLLAEHLEKHPDLSRLARNPFVLTLFCGITSAREKDNLPTTRSALYEQAVARIQAYHNSTYPQKRIDPAEMLQIQRLALWLIESAPGAPRFVFDGVDASAAGVTRPSTMVNLAASRFVTLAQPEGEALQFLHASLQEYLAARQIKAEGERLRRRIEAHAHDGAWQEPLRFAAGLNPPVVFWEVAKRLAANADRAGLIDLRLARWMTDVGARDGGLTLLGLDLRERLWQRILDGLEWTTFLNAYLDLDRDHVVRRLRAALSQATGALRARLLRALGRARTREASEILVRRILGQPLSPTADDAHDSAIARYAELDAQGLAEVRAVLADPLRGDDARIRAADALAQRRDLASVATLLTLLDHPTLRVAAARALGRIGGADALRALSERMADGGEDLEAIVAALSDATDPEKRDLLLSEIAARSPDDPWLLPLLEGLCEVPLREGSEVIEALLRDHPEPSIRAAAAWALSASTGVDAIEALSEAGQGDDDLDVRGAALGALRTRARPTDVYWLARLTREADLPERLRADALTALLMATERFGHLADWNLRSVAASVTNDALSARRGELALAAATHAYSVPDLAPLLLQVAEDEGASLAVREAACTALGQLQGAVESRTGAVLELLVRGSEAAPDDFDSAVLAPHDRLARAAADALVQLDPVRLLGLQSGAARAALTRFSLTTGALAFRDRIVWPGEPLVGPAAPPDAESARVDPGAVPCVVITSDVKDAGFVERLAVHLRPYEDAHLLSVWHRGLVATAAHVAGEVAEHVERAAVIVVLLSADYLASSEQRELQDVLRRAPVPPPVVPVLVRACAWQTWERGALQPIPEDVVPIAGRVDEEACWVQVADKVAALAREVSSLGRATACQPS